MGETTNLVVAQVEGERGNGLGSVSWADVEALRLSCLDKTFAPYDTEDGYPSGWTGTRPGRFADPPYEATTRQWYVAEVERLRQQTGEA